MSKRVVVEAEAEAELELGVQWYEDEEDGKGLELSREAKERVMKLADATVATGVTVPGIPPELPIRRGFLHEFPYAVIYAETEDTIHVLA